MKFYSAFIKETQDNHKIFLELNEEFLTQEGWLGGDEICLKVFGGKIELINQTKAIRDRKNNAL